MRTVPVTLLALAVLTGCGSSPGSSGEAAALPSSSPSAPASPSATAAESPSPGGTAPESPPPSGTTPASPGPRTTSNTQSARAIYWIGGAADPLGPKLYREFVARADTPDLVRDAVEAMLSTEPADPDYTSLWAEGTTVRDVRREGTTAVVDLSQQAKTNGGGSAFEAATVQQLVHTVTAADPTLTAVRLIVEGQPIETLWGSVGTDKPLTRGQAAEVLGPVWLDLPQGGTLTGKFGGTASVFEATVSWQLRQGSRVVKEGFSTATIGAPGRGEWSATVTAPAGTYDLWAFAESAEDGSMQFVDSKQVTIRG